MENLVISISNSPEENVRCVVGLRRQQDHDHGFKLTANKSFWLPRLLNPIFEKVQNVLLHFYSEEVSNWNSASQRVVTILFEKNCLEFGRIVFCWKWNFLDFFWGYVILGVARAGNGNLTVEVSRLTKLIN